MGTIQTIEEDGTLLAYIVPPDAFGDGTTYVTPDDFPLQMGLLSYEPGGKGVAHWHPDRVADEPTHQEAIIVVSGRIEVDIYNTENEFVESATVEEGGAAFFVDGGRGWTAMEDTNIFEVNLGPYLGLGENKVEIDDG